MISKEWHNTALELRDQGLSGRAIANLIGKSKTQVNDFFKSMSSAKQEVKSEKKGPRILIYDLETAPILAHVWKLWDNNVGLNQIEQDWYIMSFCCKWLGEDEIFYFDQRDEVDQTDDAYLLIKLWSFLNEADIVVGQNIKKFDTRRTNARFILNGLPKPSSYRQIDTMTIAKEQFGFTSNRLEYLSKSLCPGHVKSKHSKYPGHEMWVACMSGDVEAWKEMESYNKDDVLATEQLYNVLSSWDNKLPNYDVYVDDVLDMSEWEEDGYHYNNLGKYKRYRNKVTGVQRRSRVNELSKEKRDSLLRNIV